MRNPKSKTQRSSGFQSQKPGLLILFLAISWMDDPAFGTQRDWVAVGLPSAVWSDPNNWNPAGVPQNDDDLRFDFVELPIQSTTTMVNDLTNLTVNNLQFISGSWQLSGNELAASGSIGNEGDGVVQIQCAIRSQGMHLFARSDGTLDLAGPISGFAILIEVNVSAGTVKFSGTEANTFEGGLLLNPGSIGGNFVLEKQSGLAVPESFIIGRYWSVKLNRPHQIADDAWVSLGAGASLLLQGNTEAIGRLDLDGASLGGRSLVDTGGATLSVGGNITGINDYVSGVPTIKGKLGLPPGDHSIVAGGNQVFGLVIEAQILGDGGFTKTGSRALMLQGSNIFNGDIIVDQGGLVASHPNAFGSVAGFTYLTNSGFLSLDHVAIYGESLFARGNFAFSPVTVGSGLSGVGKNIWSGPIILDTNLVVSGDTINLNGLISGPGKLDCAAASVEISGTDANTFTGALLVRNPLLTLNKTAGVAAFNGPLVVGEVTGSTCEARWLQNYQRVNANVTVFANSLVNLNNFSDDLGPITFNGGTISTGTGQLGLYGVVTANTADTPATINGHLSFSAGYHEFNVGPSIASNGLQVNADIFGSGHLRKSGPGHLWLNNANAYTGLTVLDAGTLLVNNPAALGDASTGTTVNDGATLALVPATIQLPEPLAVRGTGVAGDGALDVYGTATLQTPFPSIYACLDLTTNATVRVESGGQLTANGFISGYGSLTKTGPGKLVFMNGNANTYSGDTLISEGNFELRKPNGAISIPGNLTVGPASVGSPAIARFFQTGGINANATATVNANSLLDLNGNSHTLAQLTLNDGGNAQTVGGRLNFAVGGVVQVGSLSPFGSHAGSTISGGIGLPANNFITFNVAPFAISPPFPTGPELDVPAIISVNGFDNVNFEPAGFSKTGLGRMRLLGNNTYKGEAFVSGGTLEVDGSQPQSPVGVGAGARLQGTGTIGHVNFSGSSGVIAPGTSPGILTTSNFNAGTTGNGILQIELNGTTPGSGYDQVSVRGSVTLTGTTLNGSLNFVSAVGNEFVLIDNDGNDAVIGAFNGLPQDASVYIGGQEFGVSYTGGSGNDVALTRIPTRPLPTLAVEPVPPAFVRLLWPTNYPDFHLEFSTNPPAGNWFAALPLPAVLGTNFVVTNSTAGAEFSSAAVPVAWYRLGENDPGAASGLAVTNTTSDSVGGNHLKEFGGPLYTDAVSSEAADQVASSLGVQLNGSSQYFSNAVVTTAVDNFGVEAWVKPGTVDSTYYFVAYNGDTANNGWGIAWQSGQFQGWYGNVVLFGSGAATPGTWSHVALVRDNGSSTLYVNGIPAGSPTGISPHTPTAGFALGVRPQAPSTQFFNGAIDEVRVFTFEPGHFSTNDLLLNRNSTATSVPAAKLYRLRKP